MWFQSRKKEDDSRILQLLKDLAAEVSIYTEKVTQIQQEIKSLRGLVNRKLGNEIAETLKSSDGLDELRKLPKHQPW